MYVRLENSEVELCVEEEQVWVRIFPDERCDSDYPGVITLEDATLLYGLLKGAEEARLALQEG